MINAYDFDETIYDGDSSVDFYFFCLDKNKKILLQLPVQIMAAFMYFFRIINKTKFKEKMFSYLKRVDNIDECVSDFWLINYVKIKEWYIDQRKPTDVIISDSPEFLLKPLEKYLDVRVIGSIVNKETGKFESLNCHDYEKVKRYKSKYRKKIKCFFSNSIKADRPMFEFAEEAYLVNKNRVIKIEL